MKLVPLNEIPIASAVPTINLMEVLRTCLFMEELSEAENGCGLSAVQVGIPWKLFVAKSLFKENSKYRYFVDCEYFPSIDSQKIKSIEGCLSIKDSYGHLLRFEVERHNKINIQGFEVLIEDNKVVLKKIQEKVDNFDSIIFQHEIDHGNGILISNFGKPVSFW